LMMMIIIIIIIIIIKMKIINKSSLWKKLLSYCVLFREAVSK